MRTSFDMAEDEGAADSASFEGYISHYVIWDEASKMIAYCEPKEAVTEASFTTVLNLENGTFTIK